MIEKGEESKERKTAGLYVHIPFCIRKCAYCDFLSAPGTEDEKEHYVNLICKEIEREAVRYSEYRGETVFFGGGTPTVLKPERLEKMLCKLQKCFPTEEGKEPEISIECNPGTVSEEDLQKLRKAGFNRLSIGLQSAQNEELAGLGRIHSWEDFLETYRAARAAGFQNINVDIMSALPGQSIESYTDTLRKVTGLRPEHISAYSLIIEEGTPFYERFAEADRQRQKYGEDKGHLLPSEEEERRLYEMTEEMLGQAGYHRYEISNYALPGYECRHNITYWRRGNYLGFGLGAASLMENCRFMKTRDIREYENIFRHNDYNKEWAEDAVLPEREKKKRADSGIKEDLHREEQPLSIKEQMEEFMFLGLRMMEGVSVREFQEYFHVPVEDIYGDVLKRLEGQELLVRERDRIFLTKRGIDISNAVFTEFLL